MWVHDRKRPCRDFAGVVPASRGTRPLPVHPLPSPPFQSLMTKQCEQEST